MHPELESLLRAYDAYREARGAESHARLQLYEARLAEIAEGHGAVSKESLHRAVKAAYWRWVHRQQKPSTLSPKARKLPQKLTARWRASSAPRRAIPEKFRVPRSVFRLGISL
jgi:hypothetical protein